MKPIRNAYALLSPAIVWLTLFLVVPVALITVISFSTDGGYGLIIYEFSLDAYLQAFDPFYLQIIWQSIVWAFVSTVICLLVGYPFAYFIAHSGKWKNILLILVMIPFWSNLLIRLYAWVILLNNEGVINQLLLSIGIISEPITMLYTPFSIIVGMVYGFLPFMILPIYASIEQLDRRYLEAAEDLGAGPVSTFLRVTLPITMPGVIAGVFMTFIPAVSVFVITDLLTGNRLVMIGNVIRDAFVVEMNWQLGSALSILLMALVLLSVLIFTRFTSSRSKRVTR
ncbi:spermidine/putrescine ABC transporter permease [Bacillaceae bacterium JMAK1]|nr:spermidine/putrescine ABC transporter permease [Bacillaceae bacterium JMAK1]